MLLVAAAQGQTFVTLEQAASRSGHEMTAVYEGRSIAIRGQVAGAPVWALGTYYLAVRDATDHGLFLRGTREQFADIVPGDWIEAHGSIQSRGALPMLVPDSILKTRHETAPEPKELSVADLTGLRYLGLVVRTTATVTSVAENLGGRSFEVSDRGNSIAVFLPRAPTANPAELRRVRAGDRVRITALATQYTLEPPYDGGFQLMLAAPEAVEVVPVNWLFQPLLLLGAIGAIGLLLAVWWIRETRVAEHRRSMRAFHALSEDIISAASPGEIAEKLATVLPSITQATGVRLYVYNRRAKALERVPTKAAPDPMMVPIDSPPGGLASGAVVCFRNKTLLNVPDVRRSPFVKVEIKMNLPRSAIFLPLLSQNDVLGVLEVGNARRLGYFSVEEQASAQHLANQVAASLKLQDQQTIREQLFRSEKLAATGQLISGVASELRAPLESILQLSMSLATYGGKPVPERDLKILAGESLRASEIVSRLVSFARPEDSAARPVDVNALVANLMQFREPEWKMLGLRVQNRLSAEPAPVMGAQGQIEQVFLNLLVHAEQSAVDGPGKSISVASTLIARRVTVEISYPAVAKEPETESSFFNGRSAENGALGLGVCQGIIQSHGGEIRFGVAGGTARFEIDLPIAREAEPSAPAPPRKPASTLTLLLVDPDSGAQRQLIGLLSARGHRVVPAPMEEAADLAHRVRFDAVFWAMGGSTLRSGEFQERVRSHVPVMVLLSDGYDAELARSLEAGGSFLLARPVREAELQTVLSQIEARSSTRVTGAG
jgi:signal transduction histidine kinase